MLALRLSEEAARRREEAGGVVCPWEVDSTYERENPATVSEHAIHCADGQLLASSDEGTSRESEKLASASTPIPVPPFLNLPQDIFPEKIHQILPAHITRPIRSGRRRETAFPGPVTAETITKTVQQLIAQERSIAGQGYFHTPQELLGLPDVNKKPTGPWGFDEPLVKRFPALLKRNFACIQEHQATAYHFDLRLQVDGGTFSWAVPKGFINLQPGAWHYAVQTPIHPISYTVHEGSDGRAHKNGTRCGTLLWDICEYSIGSPTIDREQSPDSGGEESDELGKHEEAKLRHALYARLPRFKKSRYIKLVLKNGRKFTNHSFTIFQTDATYDSRGNPKKQWIIKLGHGVTEAHSYPTDAMRSVKSGRLLEEVAKAGRYLWFPRPDEQATNIDEGDLAAIQ